VRALEPLQLDHAAFEKSDARTGDELTYEVGHEHGVSEALYLRDPDS